MLLFSLFAITSTPACTDNYPECEPVDTDVDVHVSFTFDLVPPGGERTDFLSTCTVSSIDETGDTTVLELECLAPDGGTEGHTYSISNRPAVPLDLFEGETVTVAYTAWWAVIPLVEWLIIRDAHGEVVIASTNGSLELPDEPGWYDPLEVSVVEGLCPAREDLYDCCAVERQAIDIRYGNDEVRVSDGRYGTVGGSTSYTVLVARAYRYLEPYSCTDQPPFWHAVAIIRNAP